MTVAPWLQSPNVLQIAQAGTQAGLGLRHQNLAEATEAQQAQQAADLLNFHYQQLQAEQQQKQSELAQHAEATKEALAGHAAQEQALELHRRALEAHQLNQEDRTMKAAQALEKHRNAIEAHQLAMEQAAQDRLNKPQPEAPKFINSIPIMGADGKPIPEFFGVPSATGKGATVHKRTTGDLTPEEQAQVKYQTSVATASARIAAEAGPNTRLGSNAVTQAQQATNIIHQIYNKPKAAAVAPSPSKRVRIKRKSDGAEFFYPNANDVPKDEFEIIDQ